MTRLTRLAVGAITALALTPAAASAELDRTVTLSGSAPKAAWDGAPASSFNPSYNTTGGTCGKDPDNYCEDTLVFLDTNKASGVTLKAVIDGFASSSDFDLKVFPADSKGTPGEEEVGERTTTISESSPLGADDPRWTGPGDFETITVTGAKGYYLVRVVYFAVNNDKYKGTVEVTGAPAGGGTTPPPSGGGGSTPPPSGGGGSTPPPSGGGSSTPPPSGGGGAPAALTVTLGGIPSKAKVAAAKGIGAKVKCSTGCKGSVTAVLDAKTAKKLKLGKKPLKIGTASFTLGSGGEAKLSVKVSSKVKKAFKKAKNVTVFLSASVTDSSGGQSKSPSAKVKLK